MLEAETRPASLPPAVEACVAEPIATIYIQQDLPVGSVDNAPLGLPRIRLAQGQSLAIRLHGAGRWPKGTTAQVSFDLLVQRHTGGSWLEVGWERETVAGVGPFQEATTASVWIELLEVGAHKFRAVVSTSLRLDETTEGAERGPVDERDIVEFVVDVFAPRHET
jgi:hypothetical protein